MNVRWPAQPATDQAPEAKERSSDGKQAKGLHNHWDEILR
jgi:hypothetical protein